MSRKLWKISKFDKGINSYTDPKDLSTDEYADLVDVNVSKVGVAIPLGGQVESDLVEKTVASGTIIPGEGYFRYSCDNAFMSASVENSSSVLANTVQADTGETSYADFRIDSCVWLFEGDGANKTMPTNGKILFQLKVNNVAIMDALEILDGHDSSSKFTIGTGALASTTYPLPAHNNGYSTYSNSEYSIVTSETSFNIFNEHKWIWAEGGDTQTAAKNVIQDSYNDEQFLPGLPASSTCTPHRVVEFKHPNQTSPGVYYGQDSGLHPYEWERYALHQGHLGNSPGDFKAWTFWDSELPENNLNNPNLIFSAGYGNDGLPNGTKSWKDHWMLGFYKWDGYDEGTSESTNGYQIEDYGILTLTEINPASQFYTPAASFNSGLNHDASNNNGFTANFFYLGQFEPWDGYIGDVSSSEQYNYNVEMDTYSDYKVNYMKARQAFHSALITAINTYSGTGITDRWNAYWAEDQGAHPSVSGARVTDWFGEGIVIESRGVINDSGFLASDAEISADLTATNVSGATHITSGVKLLTTANRRGGFTDANQSPGNSNNSPVANVEIEDSLLSTNTGNAVVVTGDTHVNKGAHEVLTETWTLVIKGKSNSGDTLRLYCYAVGNNVSDFQITYTFNLSEGQNETAANAIRDLINANTGTTNVQCSSASDVSGTASYGTDAWLLTITATSTGSTYSFAMEQIWNNNILADSVVQGIDDEFQTIISKSNTATVEIADFKNIRFSFYSQKSYSWITEFSPSLTASINEKFSADENGKIGTSRYINWYYTGNEDTKPLFWDEGSILRIQETNFRLLEELESEISSNSAITIKENLLYDATNQKNMEANPSQWIGYKDLRKQFDTTTFQRKVPLEGWFLGKTARTWYFSIPETNTINTNVNGLHVETAPGTNFTGFGGTNGILYVGTKVASSQDGIDWHGTIKMYATAVYDDGHESLPGHMFTGGASAANAFGNVEDKKHLTISIAMCPDGTNSSSAFDDVRIVGIRLYYSHSEENYEYLWNLGLVSFERGFIKATTVDTPEYSSGNEARFNWKLHSDLEAAEVSDFNTFHGSACDNANSPFTICLANGSSLTIPFTEMPKTERFEDINNYSPYLDTINVDYKAHCIAGRRAFIGNIRYWDGNKYRYYNDRMIVSPVNALETFPYPDNILDLDISDGDRIVALESVGDKVVQFKRKVCYILNISTGVAAEFFVEDRHRWKGIANKNHYCRTESGLFWFNELGAYSYDGDSINNLFIRGEEDKQKLIDTDTWTSFISDDSMCGYNPISQEAIIVKSHTHTTGSDSDVYVYSFITKSWVRGNKKLYSSTNITNFDNAGSNGDLSWITKSGPPQDTITIT